MGNTSAQKPVKGTKWDLGNSEECELCSLDLKVTVVTTEPTKKKKNPAMVGNNSMRLECVIYSFLGKFPPVFPELDSVKSASSFS